MYVTICLLSYVVLRGAWGTCPPHCREVGEPDWSTPKQTKSIYFYSFTES